MDTPLLLIAWRRPHTLKKVIDSIRPEAPTRLFVACDGPNPQRAGEAEMVAATRQVIEQQIDWPCNIEKLYSDVNQGCRLGPSRAISWFFEQVEKGIILEDDCVPHPDFLNFCSELLEMYRDDQRIFQISGFNSLAEAAIIDHPYPYFFSEYGSIWGWATWRRSWYYFQDSLLDIDANGQLDLALASLDSWEHPDRRRRQAQAILNGFDAWDYQWFFARLMQRGLSIVPHINMISNIGLGNDATHTLNIAVNPIGEGRLHLPMPRQPHRIVNRCHDQRLLEKAFSKGSLRSRVASSLKRRTREALEGILVK